jgi:hypothetical protein
MNHIEQLQEASSVRGLKKLTAAALGALALMSAAPAMADVVNFESIGSATYDGKEVFGENGYTMQVIDSPLSVSGTGFAGAVGNGSDPFLCAIAACPVGNDTSFYMGLNDGAVKISRDDHHAFQLYSLNYAFVAPVAGLASDSYGMLTVTGQTIAGGQALATFRFPLLDKDGYSPFRLAGLSSAFGDTMFSSVTISSCLWNDGGACVNPSGNQAQFAIDNLVLAAVPEPSTYAMMGLGLAAIGLVSRRRNNKQANA